MKSGNTYTSTDGSVVLTEDEYVLFHKAVDAFKSALYAKEPKAYVNNRTVVFAPNAVSVHEAYYVSSNLLKASNQAGYDALLSVISDVFAHSNRRLG